MRIIPVVDLLRGQVVRGVAGRREEYRPIESLLCDGASPAAVGAAFQRLGFGEAYVADLDAIAGAEPDWPAYEALLECGLRLWVDAGAATEHRAAALLSFRHRDRALDAVIVGLESITDREAFAEVVKLVMPRRLIFSLDLRDGAPMTHLSHWQHASPETIAEEVVGLGVKRLIVLDLAWVGVGGGIATADLCRRLRHAGPTLEIITGGGVRNVGDLRLLADAGCDAALVASALHDGRLTAAHLRRFNRWDEG